MKTYVLMIARHFPKGHIRQGEKTLFRFFLKVKYKIHTIRPNYEFWEKRFKEIEKGNACLSLRQWTGTPYRSTQKEIFRFDKTHGIGIQKLVLSPYYMVDGNKLRPDMKYLMAFNDGLDIGSFTNWFSHYPKQDFAIIHFTPFRYKK